jgi:hypothetical protein
VSDIVQRVARALAKQKLESFGDMGDGPLDAASTDEFVNRSWPEFVAAARAAIEAYEKAKDGSFRETGGETSEKANASIPGSVSV